MNYFKTVFVVFSKLSNSGDLGDFEAKDIARNAVAESLALLTYLVYQGNLKFKGFIFSFIGLFLTVFLQSRRAIFSLLIAPMIQGSGKNTKIFLAMLIVFGAGFLFLFLDSGLSNSRVASIELGSRTDQYEIALNRISINPIWSYGYGEKIYDKYVHNFYLSSFFMMGIFGFALSLMITISFVISSLKNKYYKGIFLIPLFGMMVGATAEGIMTFAAWIAISMVVTDFNSENRINKNARSRRKFVDQDLQMYLDKRKRRYEAGPY